MKYVYIRSEPGLYTVGFYSPSNVWEPESDHGSKEDAAKRVAWLNGGSSHDFSPDCGRVMKLKQVEEMPEGEFIAIWEYGGHLWCDNMKKNGALIEVYQEYYDEFSSEGYEINKSIYAEAIFLQLED